MASGSSKKANPRGVASGNMKASADKKKQGQARGQATSNRAKAQSRKTAASQLSGKSKPKIDEAGVGTYAAVRLAQAGVKSAMKAVAAQNKAAKTYITVNPARSAAAKKAAKTRAANIEKRVEGARSKGRSQGLTMGAAAGAAAMGTANSTKGTKKVSRPVNPASVRAKAEAKKKKK